MLQLAVSGTKALSAMHQVLPNSHLLIRSDRVIRREPLISQLIGRLLYRGTLVATPAKTPMTKARPANQALPQGDHKALPRCMLYLSDRSFDSIGFVDIDG